MRSFQYIQTGISGGVGSIVMNRPDVLNAMVPEMLGEMIDALAAFETDDTVRAVLLRGAGRGFSAGGDSKFLESMTHMTAFEIKNTVYRYFGTAVRTVKLFPKPTVAAVQGVAMGAGFELALAADFRLVSPSAEFCETWINLGLISPLGGMMLLPRLVGMAKATEILMLGETVDGAEAVRIGLANRLVAEDQLQAEAETLAKRLADGPPLALRAMKEGLRRGMESTMSAEWEHNVYVQGMLINSNDYAEAIAAMQARRKPEFKGE